MIKKLLVLGVVLSMASICAVNDTDVFRLVDQVEQKQTDLEYVPRNEVLRRYKYTVRIVSHILELSRSGSPLLQRNGDILLCDGKQVVSFDWLFTELATLRSDATVEYVEIVKKCSELTRELGKVVGSRV